MNDLTEDAINWPLCVKLANNNPDIAEELLGMFVAELPQTSEDLRQFYMQHNWEKFAARVHKLHGGACYVGVPHLREVTRTLEQLLIDKAHTAIITAQYEQLLEAIDDVAENYQNETYKEQKK